MKRINTPTAVNGRFRDGDGRENKATQFNAEWCNQVQEELCNIITFLTGSGPTGQNDSEAGSALFYLLLSGNGGIKEHKIEVGSSYWENVNQFGPKISNLRFVDSVEAEFENVTIKSREAQNGGNIGYGANGAYINSFYSISAGIAEFVTLTTTQDATVGGDLSVTGDATVGGDVGVTGNVSVTGDVSTNDINASGTATADGGFETNNGDIKSTNGDLDIGGNVKFKTDGAILVASSLGDESAITTKLRGRPDGSFALIVNKMSTALQFSGDSLFAKNTFQVPGYTAVQVVKVDSKVYPVGGDYV